MSESYGLGWDAPRGTAPVAVHGARDRGFTLMEMLVVVAMIAALVSIAILAFTAQFERAKEAADAANIRSSYAEVMAVGITGDESSKYWRGALWRSNDIELRQGQSDWQNTQTGEALKSIATVVGTPQAEGLATVEYDPQLESPVIRFYTKKGNAVGQRMDYKLKTRWTYANPNGNAVGQYLYNTSEAHWKTSSMVDLLELKGGTQISLGGTSGVKGLDPNSSYSIGVFTLDANDKNGSGSYKIVADSGEQMLSREQGFSVALGGGSSSNVKVALQFFKHPDGRKSSRPAELSDAEMRALLSLVHYE